MSNVCPRCRTYNSDSSRFCSKCGAPLPARQGAVAYHNVNANAGNQAYRSSSGSSGTFSSRSPHGEPQLCTAALVLGIVSCSTFIIPFLFWIGLACGIVGLVFSVIDRKKQRLLHIKTGKATAGFVTSIVGTSLCGISVLFTIIACASYGCVSNSIYGMLGSL